VGNWPYLKQVFKYECIVIEKKTGVRTENVCFGVTSLAAAKAGPNACSALFAVIGESRMNFTIAAMSV
jgi:hypothetical protein